MGVNRKTKLIVLKKPVKPPDGRGGSKPTYETAATVWAEFWKPTITAVESTGTIISELIRKIAIWRRSDIRKGWQVVYNKRTYNVEHAYDHEKNETMLVCKEVVR
ncbi:phage head closure protein [Pelosinus propionicus]|uniref:Phage head-tail adaptor, putative, SPP1 family n=1 Tax=Pelosinus propionicus DSM 13327 TaxID=1123291 RepID=A0A1I4N1H6_9FIRM|nr:phage head closure protein [Pelosinus propionicus]SFM09166.1 phage head-tail adaptor, putative, SPP1 family [Pelosinus propionicus DSM 13327]